jgi:hypothetical protein
LRLSSTRLIEFLAPLCFPTDSFINHIKIALSLIRNDFITPIFQQNFCDKYQTQRKINPYFCNAQ